jgi:hypothetical protein
MSKTIISFDIGIKNLAYCIFVVGEKTSVLKWNIVNLIQPEKNTVSSNCTCMKAGKKKAPETVCGKKGAYTDASGASIFCAVHAKSSGKIIPCKEMSMSTIKSLKLDDLKTFCKTHLIAFADSDKKPDICAKAEAAIKARTLVPIKVVKQNANHVHLVEIGKQIRMQLDEVLKVQRTDGSEGSEGSEGPLKGIKVDIVILENQISPIAGRMNTIQGMLAQYFIMRDAISLVPKIEFISSSGKLKDYKGSSDGTSKGPKGGTTDGCSSTYKDHKRDGIAFCRDFMTKNEGLRVHQEVFDSSTKKDDLADCFLQGIYYLKREKLITYSEDLEIKVV